MQLTKARQLPSKADVQSAALPLSRSCWIAAWSTNVLRPMCVAISAARRPPENQTSKRHNWHCDDPGSGQSNAARTVDSQRRTGQRRWTPLGKAEQTSARRRAAPSQLGHFPTASARMTGYPALASAVGCLLESSFPVILDKFAELECGPITEGGCPVLLVGLVKQSSLEFGTHLVRQADHVLEVGVY
jgi:hypothetical protein